jgi:hypothetical protein
MKGARACLIVFPILILVHSVRAEESESAVPLRTIKPGPTVVRPEGSHPGMTEAEQGKLENPVEVSPEESEEVRPPELLRSAQISRMETSKKPQAVEKASGMSTILGDESSRTGPTEAEQRKLIQAMRDDGVRDTEGRKPPTPRNPRSVGESQ